MKSFYSLLIPLIFCFSCLAATPEALGKNQKHSPASEQEGVLDTAQEQASEQITTAAAWLDNFFDSERYLSEENRTRAKLKLSLGYSKNDNFEDKVRVDWKISLPKLSKRLNIIISADNEEEFKVGDDPITILDQDKMERLTAAIEYFLKTGEKLNISSTFGGSYNYFYGGVRFRYFHDFGFWQGRVVDRLRYFTDDGWENRLSYDLERFLSDQWFFRTTAAAKWLENREGFLYSYTCQTYLLLSEEKALIYETNTFFETKPNHIMSDLQFRLRYRHRFYRDWLVLEVAPQLTFPEDHNRDPSPGIIIQFEADLGYQHDRKFLLKSSGGRSKREKNKKLMR